MDAIQTVDNAVQTAGAGGTQAPIAEEVDQFRQALENQPLLQDPAVAGAGELERIDALLGKLERGELTEQEIQELGGTLEEIMASLEHQLQLRAVGTQIAVTNTMIAMNLVNGALFSADMLSSSILSAPHDEIS